MNDIVKTGIYHMPASEYHADPCSTPALSASIAKIIWSQSLKHAWHAHPRLNPEYQESHKTAFDLGTACHDVLLEGGTGKIAVVDANDWRTKAAQAARQEAYDAGLTPLLQSQAEQVYAMADVARDYISKSSLAGLFDDGVPEQVMAAPYKQVWMRGRLDWMTSDRKLIVDYKSVGQSASPEQFARSALFAQGHDIQAAMYTLLNRLTGGPMESAFVWLVQETTAPYACSLVGASGAVLEIGEQKLEHCITRWHTALETDNWPAYGGNICYPDIPPWELAKVESVVFGKEYSE